MELFSPFYLLLSLIISFSFLKEKKLSSGMTNLFLISFFSIFLISIGFRDVNYSGDTQTYLRMFEKFKDGLYDGGRLEFGFVFLFKFFSLLDLSERLFIFSVAFIQVSFWFILVKNIFIDSNKKKIIAALLIISSFFVYNLGANVLRQGLAIPLILLSLYYALNKRYYTSFVFLFLAISFHKTSIVFLFAYLIVLMLNIKVRYYVLILLITTVLSVVGGFDVVINLLPSYISGYQYLFLESSFKQYQVGFRLDFWLFTLIPMVLYLFLKDEHKEKRENIIKIYITLFCVFIVLFSMPFSDRFGVYLWCLMLFLVSDFFSCYKYKILNDFYVYIFVVTILGIVSFNYHYSMNLGYNYIDVF